MTQSYGIKNNKHKPVFVRQFNKWLDRSLKYVFVCKCGIKCSIECKFILKYTKNNSKFIKVFCFIHST